VTEADMHYFEPAKGHGMKHNPFNAIVAPRPIGWISTKGRDGSLNLAPYSFFNIFNYAPPIIGFCSTGAKDSQRNAVETGEFVWNLVTRDVAAQMNDSSADLPYGEDEFIRTGLTPIASRLVAAPRVAESKVQLECKVTDVVRLRDIEGRETVATMVFGEVIAAHIDRRLIVDGVFDTFHADIVVRAGGPTAYAEIRPESRLDMRRPG
jgi:flavin reductase (DIM6/NTAB) family NADH-FMN oxidoreductase RutF